MDPSWDIWCRDWEENLKKSSGTSLISLVASDVLSHPNEKLHHQKILLRLGLHQHLWNFRFICLSHMKRDSFQWQQWCCPTFPVWLLMENSSRSNPVALPFWISQPKRYRKKRLIWNLKTWLNTKVDPGSRSNTNHNTKNIETWKYNWNFCEELPFFGRGGGVRYVGS